MKTDAMQKLLDIMTRLRDPKSGCPWDLEQTFTTIAPHTIEEAYEVADAIERGEMGELKDELGDLLFQVVFYTQMAREEGAFDFEDVVAAISEKMLRRHPHVFADARIVDVVEQSMAWEQHKAKERKARSKDGAPSELEGVARALPALARAGKLQKRAAKVGFDWPSEAGVLDKVAEELAEVRVELAKDGEPNRVSEEMGDLLFSCVNLARHLGVDAETALRTANAKFEYRFKSMENNLQQEGRRLSELSSEAMDRLWEQIKREQKER